MSVLDGKSGPVSGVRRTPFMGLELHYGPNKLLHEFKYLIFIFVFMHISTQKVMNSCPYWLEVTIYTQIFSFCTAHLMLLILSCSRRQENAAVWRCADAISYGHCKILQEVHWHNISITMWLIFMFHQTGPLGKSMMYRYMIYLHHCSETKPQPIYVKLSTLESTCISCLTCFSDWVVMV